MNHHLRRLTLLFLALAVPVLRAQTSVELNVSRTEAYVNEPLTLEIAVNNFKTCEPPAFPEIPNGVIRDLGAPTESSISFNFNGRGGAKISRTYRYELTPRKIGELVVPPIKVQVDGKAFETERVRIKVNPSDADELLFAEITAAPARLYVGQRVPLTLRIFVKPARAGGNRLNSNTMLQQFEGSALGPFPPRVQQREEQRQRPDGSTQLYYVYETSVNHTLTRPGPLAFDNVEIGMNYPTRFGRTVWGEYNVTAWRALRAKPQALTPEVRPLPTEGRPANFAGAVGAYDITVAADPASVRVGDPIRLKIELSGTGEIDALPPPRLAADPRLTKGFRVSAETPVGETVLGRRRFTQIIRALSPDVTEIPPIEYPYFDSEAGQYKIARSRPLPLAVAAAEKLEAADLTNLAGPRTAPAEELEPLDGLRGNETREAVLLAVVRPVQLWQVAAGVLAPPAVFVFAWGCVAYRAARRGDAAGRRRQNALAHARRRIEAALRAHQENVVHSGVTDASGVSDTSDAARASGAPQLPHEIAAALIGYLADRFDEPPARFAGRAAGEFLAARGVRAETLRRWTELVEQCERASFGGQPDGDAAALARAAGECLELLERERL